MPNPFHMVRPSSNPISPKDLATTGPTIKPSIVVHLHVALSPKSALSAIPEIPNTRPVSERREEVDRWSRYPPREVLIGVKDISKLVAGEW
jgi:hypothetical protein